MQEDERSEVPVLRWVFGLGADRLQCELSLDHQHFLYELRMRRLGANASESIEQYRDAIWAFRRQSELERALVEDGWSLEQYEQRRRV